MKSAQEVAQLHYETGSKYHAGLNPCLIYWAPSAYLIDQLLITQPVQIFQTTSILLHNDICHNIPINTRMRSNSSKKAVVPWDVSARVDALLQIQKSIHYMTPELLLFVAHLTLQKVDFPARINESTPVH